MNKLAACRPRVSRATPALASHAARPAAPPTRALRSTSVRHGPHVSSPRTHRLTCRAELPASSEDAPLTKAVPPQGAFNAHPPACPRDGGRLALDPGSVDHVYRECVVSPLAGGLGWSEGSGRIRSASHPVAIAASARNGIASRYPCEAASRVGEHCRERHGVSAIRR
jgi:hypothetical protein